MKVAPHAPMNTVAHDVNRWGPLRAAVKGEPRCMRFVGLVRKVMVEHGLAQVEAAEAVLAEVPEGGVFILKREGPAARVQEGQGVGHVRVPVFAEFSLELFGEPSSQSFSGAQGVLDYLRWHWVKHGDADTELDGCWNPALAPRAGVFALLESDAEALLGRLGAQLDHGNGAVEKKARVAAAEEACRPPPDFRPNEGWTPTLRVMLLRQFEELSGAYGRGCSAAALNELHVRWGYAAPTPNGGGLSKVLTRARQERDAAATG